MSKRFEELKKKAVSASSKKGWLKTAKEHQSNRDWMQDAAVIALKLLDALEARDMTQKELAAKLGVTPQAVNKIVKGKQNLTLGTIRKLEKALDISLISLKQVSKKPQYKTKLSPNLLIGFRSSKSFYTGKVSHLRGSSFSGAKTIKISKQLKSYA